MSKSNKYFDGFSESNQSLYENNGHLFGESFKAGNDDLSYNTAWDNRSESTKMVRKHLDNDAYAEKLNKQYQTGRSGSNTEIGTNSEMPPPAAPVEKKSISTSPIRPPVNEGIQVDIPQHPKFPMFEDQLKQIREDYANEYETKMKRGFLELNELKKDITNKQEVYETQQIRELRREIKRLENEL